MSQHFAQGSTPLNTDTRRIRWAKMLLFYQNLSDALAVNNLKATDTLRAIRVKLLNAIVNHG